MGSLQRFDAKAAGWIGDIPSTYRSAMIWLTFVGEPAVVLLIGLVGFITAVHGHQRAAERAFVYAALAFGFNTLLKLLLHRRRPHGLIVQTLGVPSYSFPSGHAFGSVIFYGLLAYLDIRYLPHPWDFLTSATLIGLIFLIGLSRVYLGAHYPSDVSAGWILGGLSLLILVRLAF